MAPQILTSSDGIQSELVSTSRRERPSGFSKTAPNFHPGDTLPIDNQSLTLAESWDCAPEDFAAVTPRGLVGKPSAAACVRIGRMALKMGEACAWTLADCVLVLVGDKPNQAKYESVAGKLGISGNRAEKFARAARCIPPAERNPGVGFTAHEEVCALEYPARAAILAQAEVNKLPVAAVKELVRAAKAEGAGRNSRGGRKARTPVAPTITDTGAAILQHAGTGVIAPSSLPLPAHVPVDAQPVPAGISHVPPSLTPSLASPRFVLGDQDARDLLWNDCGFDMARAEAKMAEIIRAYYAAK